MWGSLNLELITTKSSLNLFVAINVPFFKDVLIRNMNNPF